MYSLLSPAFIWLNWGIQGYTIFLIFVPKKPKKQEFWAVLTGGGGQLIPQPYVGGTDALA